MAAIGAVALVVGFAVAFASFGAGFWILLIGFFMVAGGLSGAKTIEQLRSDEAALASFEASRRARQAPPRVPYVAPAQPEPPVVLEQAAAPALPSAAPMMRRPAQRGMRRPKRQAAKD